MEKDKTEVGITGKPVPKPKTAKQQHELEKKRRMRKHLGQNVGGTQYSSDVNPYLNPRSVREEVLVDYLLDEGFASDEKSASAIASAMSEDWKQTIFEATAMKRRGLNEPAIRQSVASSTGGGTSADRATALENQPTYGDANKEKQRQNLARAQRGDYRNVAGTNAPGSSFKSNDPNIKSLQASRAAQRSALTPKERTLLNRPQAIKKGGTRAGLTGMSSSLSNVGRATPSGSNFVPGQGDSYGIGGIKLAT